MVIYLFIISQQEIGQNYYLKIKQIETLYAGGVGGRVEMVMLEGGVIYMLDYLSVIPESNR